MVQHVMAQNGMEGGYGMGVLPQRSQQEGFGEGGGQDTADTHGQWLLEPSKAHALDVGCMWVCLSNKFEGSHEYGWGAGVGQGQQGGRSRGDDGTGAQQAGPVP